MIACAIACSIGLGLLADEPASSTPISARVPLDSVAAVVERKVVTVSEVRGETRLALLEKAGPAAAEAPLDGRLLSTVLDHIVIEELLSVEARKHGDIIVKESEIDARAAALRALFVDADAYKTFARRHGIDDELVRGRIRRELTNKRLLALALAEAQRVSDDEARAWLKEHPQAGDADAQLKEARESLSTTRREAAFAELVRELKRTVDVRVVASFS